MGASTSWNPQDFSRPVMGLLFLCQYSFPNRLFHPEVQNDGMQGNPFQEYLCVRYGSAFLTAKDAALR
jgi:hypothetical protein